MTVVAACAAWVYIQDRGNAVPVLAHADGSTSFGHTQILRGGLVAETLSIEPSVFKIREFLRGHEVQELVSLALSANINHDDLAWSRTSDGRRSTLCQVVRSTLC